MRNPKEDDLYSCPTEPNKWTRPADNDDLNRFRYFGWLDKEGNITEEGRLHGMCRERLEGTETEEHYQWRRRVWKEEEKVFQKWFDEKWGENGHTPHPDLPYPAKEMMMVKFRVK